MDNNEAHDHDHSHPLLKFFDFSLPRQEVISERQKRLQNIARNTKLQGFRPGKAPMSLIEKRYGDGVAAEIVEELSKKLIEDKMKNEKSEEKLASRVSYHPSGENDESYIFHAHYEVFPEFDLALDKVPVVKKPKIDVDDKAINEMVQWMCRIYGEDQTVDTIENADRVTMKFEMIANDGSDAVLLNIDPYQFVVPIHKPESYIDFPAGPLLGKKVGETVEWTHQYPEDFANPLVAGQSIKLKATIQSVIRKNPLSEDTLFERLGLKEKTTEEKQAEIRKQITNQVERRTNSTFSGRLGKALCQAHASIDVPPSMQQAELQQQGERVRKDIQALRTSETPREKALLERLENETKQQLQTQIIWLKISENMPDKVEQEDVLKEIRTQCEEYENADLVYEQMSKDRDSLQKAYEAVHQQKMMGWLVQQIKVEDEPVVFAEYMIG